MRPSLPGWQALPWAPDGEELSTAVFLPWDSWLEARLAGLPEATEEAEFALDDAVVPMTTVSGRAIAGHAAAAGRHRAVLRWRPARPELPLPNSEVVARKAKSLREVEEEMPDLVRAIMKHHRPERFVMCPIVIVSFPARDVYVYGIFTIDLCALRKLQRYYIKQEYIVYEPTAQRGTYYSAFPAGVGATHEHITMMCERFGEPHFGCRKTQAGWELNHWYVEGDPELPTEPSFRSPMDRTLLEARSTASSAECP